MKPARCETVDNVSDHERFEALARDLIEPLRRFLVRRAEPETAEDVLADTLLVIWRRLDDVPDEALPWAYGVARNCLANALRTGRRQQRVAAKLAAIDPPRDVSHPDPDPDHGDHADLAEALATLSETDAELLRLWAWEQLSVAEIAEVLEITANAAGVRLHRARGKLRTALGKDGAGAGHEESREGRRP